MELKHKSKYKVVANSKKITKMYAPNMSKKLDNDEPPVMSTYEKIMNFKKNTINMLPKLSNPFCRKSEFLEFKQEVLDRLNKLETKE